MKKILIAHGDPLVRQLLSARLEEARVPVASASTGAEARSIIARISPDLVVVDYFLPESEGPALLQFLQRNPGGTPIPSVVFVNPHTRLDEIAQAAGATYTPEESPSIPGAMMESLVACMGPGRLPAQVDNLAHWPSRLTDSALEQTQRDADGLLGNALHALLPITRGNRDLRSFLTLAGAIHPISSRAAFAGLCGVYRIASALESLTFECYENPTVITESTVRAFSHTLDLLHTLLAPENIVAARDAHPARAVCVEDEPDIRSLIRDALARVGTSLFAASNSREAIAYLDNERTDAILLDIGLPDCPGFELCANIRKLPFHGKTPIVFLTGHTDLLNRAQARLSGGDDFMSKPFRPTELALKMLYWIYHPHVQSVKDSGPSEPRTA